MESRNAGLRGGGSWLMCVHSAHTSLRVSVSRGGGMMTGDESARHTAVVHIVVISRGGYVLHERRPIRAKNVPF